jgi:hypothetical protein
VVIHSRDWRVDGRWESRSGENVTVYANEPREVT